MSKNFKSARKLAMILAIGGMSFSAMAGSNPGGEDTELLFTPTGANSTVVVKALNLEADGLAKIKVLNQFGRAIWENSLEKGTTHEKQYDFSQLEAGRYKLVLESPSKQVAKPFVVGMNGVVREDHTEALANFTPRIKQRNDERAVRVTFTNPADAALMIQLVDQGGRVLYSDKAGGNQDYAKAINMKKLKRGSYKVIVFNGDYYHQAEVYN